MVKIFLTYKTTLHILQPQKKRSYQIKPNMTEDILDRLMLALSSNLPIILFTGDSLDISNDKTLLPGVRNFLIKPLVVRSFAVNIRKIPDHKKNKSTMTKRDEML